MIKHWINGREVESKDVFENYNPATGELIGEVASGGAAEIDAAVAAAREAFPKWANTPAKERARLMRRLGELIDRNVPHLAELETLDTGLPIHQTKNVLIPRASHNFEFFAEVCTRMNGHSYPVDDQMLNYTLYQPVGVCGLVSPWNVPFMTATWKTAPCLALGNTAVLKMSELSPLTANELGRLVHEAGIPPGVFNVVQGYGASAGDALVRHRDVRAVSFTGGTATGRRIMEAAGIKKYSMELGGKSPVLVFEDADLERALDAALFTIFSLNGERCTAGSRIFVQESVYPQFVAEFAARARRLIVGDPQDPKTQVGSMITQAHYDKVTGYIRIGLEAEYFPAYLGWLREETERLDIEYLILGCHYDTTDEQDARASRFGGSPSTAHGRRYAEQVVEALETGLYRYLAHPDLFLNRVTAFDADAEKACRDICAAAARLDIPLEYNMAGLTLQDRPDGSLGYTRDEFWHIAAEYPVKAIVGCDAHAPSELDVVPSIEEKKAFLHSLGIPVLDTLPGLE